MYSSRSIAVLVGSLVLCSGASHSATGEVTSFSSSTEYSTFNVRTSGTYGSQTTGVGSLVTAEMLIDFDWSSPTMTFNSFGIQWAGGGSWSNSIDFTAGPGQIETITTTLTFDQAAASADSFQPIVLTPETSGDYSLESGLEDGRRGSFQAALTVSGTWEVNGPTESATGSFVTDLTISPTNCFPRFWTLSTADYPDAMQLTGGIIPVQWQETSGSTYEVSTTVDGHLIEVDLYGFNAPFVNNVALSPVPEPSALLLLAMAGASMLARRRSGKSRS